MLHRVREAKIFTKLDFHGAYNLILIKEGDEYKTAFRTRYGQFESCVTQFVLTNALLTFQYFFNDCLQPSIDDFEVRYLDDILISSTNNKEHGGHARQELQWLKEFELCCKAEKCQLGVSEVSFFGFVITPDGVGMELDWISTIEDWLRPKSIGDV